MIVTIFFTAGRGHISKLCRFPSSVRWSFWQR